MTSRRARCSENGRMVHDLYLFEVKKPAEFEEALGLLQGTRGGPGDKAFPSAKESAAR